MDHILPHGSDSIDYLTSCETALITLIFLFMTLCFFSCIIVTMIHDYTIKIRFHEYITMH